MTMHSREEVENAMEYYIKMFDTVRQMQYCSHTFEELKHIIRNRSTNAWRN